MIEGLKVTIVGTELRDLCAKRADHHRERSKAYAEQIVSMERNKVEGMNYSGGDPMQALTDKKSQHDGEAGELDFIAEHLQATEQYLLGRDDLHKLGIANRGRW